MYNIDKVILLLYNVCVMKKELKVNTPEVATYTVTIDGRKYTVTGTSRWSIITNALILYRRDVQEKTIPYTYLRHTASLMVNEKFDRRLGVSDEN
jgi:hypothetical protein